ncbi:MAG TPA: hypothetical protein ENF99_00470, partial [Candidatus Aenigmarchaeota archaeon]|nr:hypothetical protein [Candidatus Aenigmarchaeota archaeon]
MKRKIVFKLGYTYFLKYPGSKGHEKRFIIGSEQPDAFYEIEICECILETLKKDLKIFEDWIKTG